jgi:hypothetical protein
MNEETLARAIKKRQATCQKIGFFRDTFVARVLGRLRKRTGKVILTILGGSTNVSRESRI